MYYFQQSYINKHWNITNTTFPKTFILMRHMMYIQFLKREQLIDLGKTKITI